MSLSIFPTKTKQASDWLTYVVYQLEACFFGRKLLELMSRLESQKEMTLVIFHQIINSNLHLQLTHQHHQSLL